MTEVPRSSIGWAISRLARYVEIALFEVDLSPVQYRTLLQLEQGPESSKILAERLSVSAPNTSVVVEGLVQRGLVERTQSKKDRRQVSIALTEKGNELLEVADEAVSARIVDIASYSPDPSFPAAALESLLLWSTALDRFRNPWLERKGKNEHSGGDVVAEKTSPLTEIRGLN